MKRIGAPPHKLVLLLQDLEFGGTQRYTVNLAANLDRSLFEPEIWVLRGGKDMVPFAEQACCKIKWLTESHRVGPQAIVSLFREIKRNPPDILYTLTGVPNIWGRPFGRLCGVPVVIASWRGLVEKQYESILWKLNSRIICNAKALKEYIIRKHHVLPERISVVPNAVNCDYFKPNGTPKSQYPLILFIGRYVVEKDVKTLADAFKIVHSEIPDAKLVMVGNGPLLDDFIHHLRINAIKNVEIIPGRPDNRDLLSKAWVFSLSSIKEGSPNVILEAMSMGLPVAATAAGGIPELVDEGQTGLLSPISQSESLANNLLKLLRNEFLRQEMGRKARERVMKEYSMDVMLQRTQAIFIECLQEAAMKSSWCR